MNKNYQELANRMLQIKYGMLIASEFQYIRNEFIKVDFSRVTDSKGRFIKK